MRSQLMVVGVGPATQVWSSRTLSHNAQLTQIEVDEGGEIREHKLGLVLLN
uniref:Uncharacterized protein n=1 Tax=Arundo donax TaxID=35708 RepID=A0A0A8YU50_ARUDO